MTNLVLAFEYMKLSTFPKCKYMDGNMPKPTITIQPFFAHPGFVFTMVYHNLFYTRV